MKIKNKNSTTIFLLLVITFTIFPNFAKGQIIQTIYPTKDASVNTVFPNDNTGSNPWLWISSAENASFGRCQAYIYFELPSDFTNYNVMNLHFYILLGDIEATFNISIYRIVQDWDEMTLNWTGKPSLGEYILSRQVESHKTYDINVKNHLSSNIFSICIIAEESQYNFGQIPSKEHGSYTGDNRLAIILSNIDTIIIISVVGIAVIAGTAVIGFFLYKRKKSKK